MSISFPLVNEGPVFFSFFILDKTKSDLREQTFHVELFYKTDSPTQRNTSSLSGSYSSEGEMLALHSHSCVFQGCPGITNSILIV